MKKFFALFITSKLEIQRCWVTNADVLHFLKTNEDSKVYRISNDQEAEIVYADPEDEITWKDVPDTEYKIV